MLKGHRRNGSDDLPEKSPLELGARFLAAQEYYMAQHQEPYQQHDPKQSAIDVAKYMDANWRSHIGAEKLHIRTCFNRPTRAMLNRICAVTSAPENVVLAIWDAAVQVTASDESLADQTIKNQMPIEPKTKDVK